MGFLGDVSSSSWTILGGGSAFVALLALFVNGIIRTQRTTTRLYGEPIRLLKEQNQGQAQQIQALERGQRECDFVVDTLIRTLQEAGIAVPAAAFRRGRRADDD